MVPETWQWQNYVDIFAQVGHDHVDQEHPVLSVTVTFLQVLTGSFAAYGFSKGRFPGRDVLFLPTSGPSPCRGRRT